MKVKGYCTFDPLKTCLVGRTYGREQFDNIKNQKVKDVLFRILDETEKARYWLAISLLIF